MKRKNGKAIRKNGHSRARGANIRTTRAGGPNVRAPAITDMTQSPLKPRLDIQLPERKKTTTAHVATVKEKRKKMANAAIDLVSSRFFRDMSVSCATDGSTLGQFPPRALAVPGIGHIPPVVQVGEIAPNTGHDGAPCLMAGADASRQIGVSSY